MSGLDNFNTTMSTVEVMAKKDGKVDLAVAAVAAVVAVVAEATASRSDWWATKQAVLFSWRREGPPDSVKCLQVESKDINGNSNRQARLEGSKDRERLLFTLEAPARGLSCRNYSRRQAGANYYRGVNLQGTGNIIKCASCLPFDLHQRGRKRGREEGKLHIRSNLEFEYFLCCHSCLLGWLGSSNVYLRWAQQRRELVVALWPNHNEMQLTWR